MYRFELFLTLTGTFTAGLSFVCLARRLEFLAFLDYRLAL
jgi:hypothetical protein